MASPFQTSKAEWDVVAQEFFEYFATWLQSRATTVDGIETYSPLTYAEFAQRVKSLPARYNYQGVKKTVLVPLELLSRDAKDAADRANASADKADKATQEANTARDNANRAAQEADKAREDFEKVRDETLAAKNAANEAANNANLAASETRKTNEEVQEAELQREEAFKAAISRFSDDITSLEGFTDLAKEAWNEFVALYEAKQTDIEEAEAQRKANETERQEAEEKRETDTRFALDNAESATKRFNEFLNHPPKVDGDPLHWWIWNEQTGEYEDTGNAAQYPEIYPIDEEVWNSAWKSVLNGSNPQIGE